MDEPLEDSFIFSKSLIQFTSKVVATSVVGGGASFVSTLLIANYLGTEAFGAWAYFLSLTAVPSIIFAAAANPLRRFLPLKDAPDPSGLTLSVFLWQIFLFCIFTCVLLWVFLARPDVKPWIGHRSVGGVNFSNAFISLQVASIPLNLFLITLAAFLSGKLKILHAQHVLAVGSISRLIFLAIISGVTADRSAGVTLFAASLFLVNSSLVIYLLIVVQKSELLWTSMWKLRHDGVRRIVFSNFRRFIFPYAIPSQLQGVSAFVLQSAAVIVLGQRGMYVAAGYYDIIRRVFTMANKIIPGLFDLLFPKVVRSKERDPYNFRKVFFRFSWFELAGYIGMSWLLLFSFPLWLPWYGVTLTEEVRYIVYIFSLNLVLSGLAHPSGWAIKLSHSTMPELFNSVSRCIIFLTLLYTLAPRFDGVGAAVALAISTLWVVALLSYFASKTELFSFPQKSCQTLGAVALHLTLLAYVL